ncbi:MAG TPA: hypothetical protein PLV85_11390, partial [Polyangiaceae bacterium]|nr:hypothetical protein [Polyangiaceae bacterium]
MTAPLNGEIVRSKAVFVVLLLMLLGFVASTLVRWRMPTFIEMATPTASSATAVVSSNFAPNIAPNASSAPKMPVASSSGSGKQPLSPLRVGALRWELLAPGLLVNAGLDPGENSLFVKAGVDAHLSVLDRMSEVEEALARGGADAKGVDVAVIPMPEFIAAYERLRALEPRVFFVVGWSRGREALYAKQGSLTNLPEGELTLRAEPGSSQAFLGLFSLQLAGAPPTRLRFELPSDKTPPDFEALSLMDIPKVDAASGKLQLTSADAPMMVPIVAVAQAGFVDTHRAALTAWVRVWLEGEDRIRADAATSAREISKQGGAPDPLVLINRLGPLSWANLADNARWAGLSGRGALTTESLFQRGWEVWKAAGLLSTPLPEAPASSPTIISALVRQLGTDQGTEKFNKNSDLPRGSHNDVLLRFAFSAAEVDEDALAGEIGFLAGLFDRSTLRVAVRGTAAIHKAKAAKAVAAAIGRFGLAENRLQIASQPARTASATIEV